MNTDSQKSAQPCGCDEGADHLCEQHKNSTYILKTENMGEILVRRTKPRPFTDIDEAHGCPTEATEGPEWAPLTTIKDSGERVTFASGSMRDPSTGKIKWSRILFGPMARRWAQHLTTAEAKYPDVAPGLPNFMLIETDEEYYRYKESALRHFMSWFYEETDEDHASATFFNINGVEIIKDKRKAQEGK